MKFASVGFFLYEEQRLGSFAEKEKNVICIVRDSSHCKLYGALKPEKKVNVILSMIFVFFFFFLFCNNPSTVSNCVTET